MDLALIFHLGQEVYGLEVGHIQEIVEHPALYYVPRAPAHIRGAINFHGTILPVLDLAAYLGFSDGEHSPRVVVLDPRLCALALEVTTIRRIVELDREAIIPLPAGQNQNFIRAVFNRQGEMINLLDIQRLLASLEKHV